MSQEQYTRCPACKTVFRVTDAQLALRDGMVRCGHCQAIFDGRAEMISLAPAAAPEDSAPDDSLLGPPTVTLRSARALEPATVTRRGQDVEPQPLAPRARDIEPRPLARSDAEAQLLAPRDDGPAPAAAGARDAGADRRHEVDHHREGGDVDRRGDADVHDRGDGDVHDRRDAQDHDHGDDHDAVDDRQGPDSLAPATAAPTRGRDLRTQAGPETVAPAEEDEPAVDFEHRFAWDKPKARGPQRKWAWGLGVVVLAIALVAQAAYHFRDSIAAHWPAARPALAAMCAALRCEVRPLRDVGALSIESSELQIDPAHKGLLILAATVRNRAGYAIAYPHLELTLTDATNDQVVVRRAFAPAEYMGGTVDVAAGLAGNAEAALKLFIDASATQQAGYRLYLFYP